LRTCSQRGVDVLVLQPTNSDTACPMVEMARSYMLKPLGEIARIVIPQMNNKIRDW